MTVIRRWVAAAAVVPVLVAGCSDDPEPKFEPSASPSPSESSSEAAQPQAWEVKSDKGAYAFVRHWVEVLNEGGKAGDTRALDALSSPSCGSCTNIIKYITDVYDEGGRIESEGWRVLQLAEINDRFPPQAPVVTARIRQTGQKVYRTSPDKEFQVPPETVTTSFHLEWDESWQLTDLVVVA